MRAVFSPSLGQEGEEGEESCLSLWFSFLPQWARWVCWAWSSTQGLRKGSGEYFCENRGMWWGPEGGGFKNSSEFHCKLYSFEVVSPIQWFSKQGWFVFGRLVTKGGTGRNIWPKAWEHETAMPMSGAHVSCKRNVLLVQSGPWLHINTRNLVELWTIKFPCNKTLFWHLGPWSVL